MARKRIIEGTWDCTSCDTRGIKGRHKTCTACGNPREKAESDFDFGGSTASGAATAATVSTPDLLELASAGDDWMCANCDASNRGDREVCRTCAARRDDPFGEPVFEDVEPEYRPKKRGPLGCIAAALATLTSGAGVLATCCGLGWLTADSTVQAELSGQMWVRQVQVDRLTPQRTQKWRDALPEPAGLPGTAFLAPGLGELYGCETLACWPRPPDGGGTARVTSRTWQRTIRTEVMDSSNASGWRSTVPSTQGRMPTSGRMGVEGYTALSCAQREKTPESCRDESYQEACGSHEECSIKDLGNGFAEETCIDVTDYCTQTREVCTDAVYADWCEWKNLSWSPGRDASLDGSNTEPRWPLLSVRSDERETRSETYTVVVERLAGTADSSHTVPIETYDQATLGSLMAVPRPGQLTRLPNALQTSDANRHDCGSGIPANVLTTRDRCDAQIYGWVAEPALDARSADGAPEWPDGRADVDGRENRTEWMLVELTWKRRELSGNAVFKDPVERWQAWQQVQSVPVVVDFDANFVSLDETYQGPIPSEVRPGRMDRTP